MGKKQRKSILFTKQQMEMISVLMAQKGYSTFTSVIHEALRSLYDKKLPNYVKVNAEDDYRKNKLDTMTPQEICEWKGGYVKRSGSGTQVCRFPLSPNDKIYMEVNMLNVKDWEPTASETIYDIKTGKEFRRRELAE